MIKTPSKRRLFHTRFLDRADGHLHLRQDWQCSMILFDWIQFAVIMLAKPGCGWVFETREVAFEKVTRRLVHVGKITTDAKRDLDAGYRDLRSVRFGRVQLTRDRLAEIIAICKRLELEYWPEVED